MGKIRGVGFSRAKHPILAQEFWAKQAGNENRQPTPMTYIHTVQFIETATFTRLIAKLMNDDEYGRLQQALVKRPDWGSVIPGSGGIR